MSETLIAVLLRLSEAVDPARLPGRVARQHFGPVFDRLLSQRVLEEQEEATTWSACTGCDCPQRARSVEMIGDRRVAICPLDAAADVVLEKEDLQSFVVDGGRLARLLSVDGPDATEVLPGLWSLGKYPSGHCAFLVLQRRVIEDPSLLASLRMAARGSEVILIAPPLSGKGRQRLQGTADIHHVLARDAVKLDGHGCLQLDLSNANLARPFIPRLSVDRCSATVSIDGTPQSLAPQPFRLLCLLVRALLEDGRAVRKDEIESHFNGRGASEFIRELREALCKGRKDAANIRNWIVTQRDPTAYKLTLPRNWVEMN